MAGAVRAAAASCKRAISGCGRSISSSVQHLDEVKDNNPAEVASRSQGAPAFMELLPLALSDPDDGRRKSFSRVLQNSYAEERVTFEEYKMTFEEYKRKTEETYEMYARRAEQAESYTRAYVRKLELEILDLRGLNSLRGLYEFLEGKLEFDLVPGLRGQKWEAYLNTVPDLVKILQERCRWKPQQQAGRLTGIMTTLSKHIHDDRFRLAKILDVGGKWTCASKSPLSTDEAIALVAVAAEKDYAVVIEDICQELASARKKRLQAEKRRSGD